MRLNRQLQTNRFHERPWLAGGLGDTLRKEGKLAEAEPLLREAVTNAAKLWPNDSAKWRWHVYNLIDLLYRQRKQADVFRVISEVLVLTPELVGPSRETALLEVRAHPSGRGGQWKDAASEFAKLIELAPTDPWLSHQLAPVLVMDGDREGHRQLCRRNLARFGSTNDPAVSQQIALDCLLLPPSGTDLPTADHLADFAVRAYRDNWYLHWFHLTQGLPDFHWYQLTKGLAEYRQGHFAGAVEWAQRALAMAGEVRERDAQAYALLAMAQHQLNHADEARAALGKAVEITQTKLPQLESGDLGQVWWDWAGAHILLREAKALMDGQAATTNQLKP